VFVLCSRTSHGWSPSLNEAWQASIVASNRHSSVSFGASAWETSLGYCLRPSRLPDPVPPRMLQNAAGTTSAASLWSLALPTSPFPYVTSCGTASVHRPTTHYTYRLRPGVPNRHAFEQPCLTGTLKKARARRPSLGTLNSVLLMGRRSFRGWTDRRRDGLRGFLRLHLKLRQRTLQCDAEHLVHVLGEVQLHGIAQVLRNFR